MHALSDGDRGAAARLRRRAVRLWRRRSVRRFALVQGPALILALTLVRLASDPATHAAVAERVATVRDALTARPEFAIRRVIVDGAAEEVRAEIVAALGDAVGASSLDLDAGRLRARVEDLGWVAAARVSLEAPETLRVAVEQREAAAVWRVDGEPWLIGAEGVAITPAFSRADHPELPLLLGAGAEAAAAEGLAILDEAGPLGAHIRGLVRIGERRWNAALSGGRVVMLPEDGAVAAMRAAVALAEESGALDAAVAAIDLRLPERPTLRLTPEGAEALRRARDPEPAAAGRDA